MHLYIVFAHPSQKSFTFQVLNAFIRGVENAGHTYQIGDLYAMNFQTDLDAEQHARETGMNPDAPVPDDVKIEQDKIESADGLVFIYPVWWSDCPAKLKGWFDRVWTLGYAYSYENGEHAQSKIRTEKALVICPAGHPVDYLEKIGIAESMRHVMVQDRLLGVGIKSASMEILGGMVTNDETIRQQNLRRAYQLGREF
ncbi:NAD(P)H-dependent oxidoreductase [candidate division KSB1 bacterium]|nr:NAD(P)H-dependent oxidoreductase [candidate division KSB1 bacterium]